MVPAYLRADSPATVPSTPATLLRRNETTSISSGEIAKSCLLRISMALLDKRVKLHRTELMWLLSESMRSSYEAVALSGPESLLIEDVGNDQATGKVRGNTTVGVETLCESQVAGLMPTCVT
ncbi:hypothetical protein PoB_006286700 [Plakobranchus ocellatus]|uniref:Uncharacterized protein n=1 Tax=Plakobranchus ocellatus TaxID=259542 RepID=A0AAV4CWR9_9GAST|nr:hypothetical protein PoB_006286700 [Plakobranchus ocellatus]